MAPTKRNTKNRKVDLSKKDKLDAFLEDFDSEVTTRVEQMEEGLTQLLKDIDISFEMEVLRLPKAVREMNWLQWWNQTLPKIPDEPESKKDKEEKAAIVESVVAEDHNLLRTNKRTTRKKQTESKSVDENTAPATQKKRGRPPTSRKTKAPSANKRNSSLRTPRSNLLSSHSSNLMDSSMMGPTPLFTPRFDSRLMKTPGFRVPRHKERVYSISVNGSPIESANEDVVINVPVGNGERIQLLASQIQSGDLSGLDETAMRSIRALKSRLATLC